MHSILQRQLRRYLNIIEEANIPNELKEFIQAINATYEHFDEDRKLLERSIDISSNELQDINKQLRLEIEAVRNSKEENKELEQMNKFMIGRELRMAELKEALSTLEAKYNALLEKNNVQ